MWAKSKESTTFGIGQPISVFCSHQRKWEVLDYGDEFILKSGIVTLKVSKDEFEKYFNTIEEEKK